MANVIPNLGVNFKVYLNGDDLLGIAEGNFPTGDLMTSEIRGAGIAGSLDMPVLGHMQSVTVSLTWRTLTKSVMKIIEPRTHSIDMYALDQDFDAGQGIIKTNGIHVFMKAITKKYDFGKLVTGDTRDTSTEHEVYYYKVWLGGSEVLEVDKFNYIYKVNGTDYLADTRQNLGMV